MSGHNVFLDSLRRLLGVRGEPKDFRADGRDAPARMAVAAMAHMCVADGKIETIELKEIARVYREVTGGEAALEHVREAVAAATAPSFSIWAYLADNAGKATDAQKLLVLKACHALALADLDLHEAERALLGRMAEAMGLPKSAAASLFAAG